MGTSVSDPRKEPTADQRQIATELFGLFNALLLAGFNEPQALILLGNMLHGASGGQKQ